MNRRIRKKKLKQKIDRIDCKINHNNQIRKEYETNEPINGFIANFAIPCMNFGLQLEKKFLINSLKRGNY